MSLHTDYTPAAWRGTTNTDGQVIGVSFDLPDDKVVRLSLDVHSARMLSESITQYLSSPAPALFACSCGNDGCDGQSYRAPYASRREPCPSLASAQSSANTATTAV